MSNSSSIKGMEDSEQRPSSPSSNRPQESNPVPDHEEIK
ncbi:unnamed protein product [Tuber melanosporum]|uniref:(Perigord truffle) hypothetical protein n=1 Tax=Tuber melanosporum (strain Mel28) TaxID=656061 RepID=D5GI25_TUBMM|nr:uncharacterized protein GSTUM_00008239001 [Tuber melanosporum]CAZ84168.1 unnamed protein product [Tuber melanosporum]